MGLIADGAFHPRVYAALPLEEAAEAHRMLEERQHFGKIVLNP